MRFLFAGVKSQCRCLQKQGWTSDQIRMFVNINYPDADKIVIVMNNLNTIYGVIKSQITAIYQFYFFQTFQDILRSNQGQALS